MHSYKQINENFTKEYHQKIIESLNAIILNNQLDENSQLEQIKKILDDKEHANFDLNSPTDNLLPLHIACAYNKLNIVKFLLERRADVNVACTDSIPWDGDSADTPELFQRTPLQFAIRGSRAFTDNNNELIELLL